MRTYTVRMTRIDGFYEQWFATVLSAEDQRRIVSLLQTGKWKFEVT